MCVVSHCAPRTIATTFSAACIPCLRVEQLLRIFNELDADGDGFIGSKDLQVRDQRWLYCAFVGYRVKKKGLCRLLCAW
jgi:hypothetical protein